MTPPNTSSAKVITLRPSKGNLGRRAGSLASTLSRVGRVSRKHGSTAELKIGLAMDTYRSVKDLIFATRRGRSGCSDVNIRMEWMKLELKAHEASVKVINSIPVIDLEPKKPTSVAAKDQNHLDSRGKLKNDMHGSINIPQGGNASVQVAPPNSGSLTIEINNHGHSGNRNGNSGGHEILLSPLGK